MMETNEIVIAAVVTAVTYVLFYEGFLYKIGDWGALRRLLPYFDEEARHRGFYTSYSITDEEYVGEVGAASVEDVREMLRDRGYIESPLAAHKTYRGRKEAISMSHYGVHGEKLRSMHPLVRFLVMLTRRKKTHITVFPSFGLWTITAHYEYSEYNPLYAPKHLRGTGMDIDEGVKRATRALNDVDSFRPSERALNIYESATGE